MKKKNVPKEERETIVNFNEADDIATIYTFNTGLKKRLAAFAEKYPDLIIIELESPFHSDLPSTIITEHLSTPL